MRRWFLAAIGILLTVFAAIAFAVRQPTVQDWVIGQVARRLAVRNDAWFDGDYLRVLICGSSSPLPDPERAKACVAIFAADRMWVVDTGPGAWNNLALWRVPGERIGAVLLTHFHSDHIGGLGEFNLQTWVAGRDTPLRVFGPHGVERVVRGFAEAYALDRDYRTLHHGAELMAPPVGMMKPHPFRIDNRVSVVVLEERGLRITAFAVDHRPIEPAVGYRFDYRGRSVVVSGDTVKDANLIRVAAGADVLVHEAQANHIVAIARDEMDAAGRARIAKILSDIPDYHSSPVEAAEIANEAGVSLLVLYHLTPPPPNAVAARAFQRGVESVRPSGVVMADDGTMIELPPGSSDVLVSHVR